MANAVGSVFDPAASARSVLSTTRFYSANTGTDAPGYVLMSAVLTYVESNATIATTRLSGTLQAAQFPAITGDITIAAGALTADITAGSIVNADINASAGIVVSKIANFTEEAQDAVGSAFDSTLVYTDGSNSMGRAAITGDITISAGSNTAAIASGVIVNADVNASAAIAVSKLAAVTASRALVSDGSGFVSAATTTATEIGYVNGVTSAIQTQLNGKASVTQTLEGAGGLIGGTVTDGDYRVFLNMPHGGTITTTTTRSTAGTGTATFKINTTALGGTANSVSTTEQSQAQASSNVFVAGDDIVITISSAASLANMSFMIKYTRTYS